MKKGNGNGHEPKVRRSEYEIAYEHGTKLLSWLVGMGWWDDVTSTTALMKRMKALEGNVIQRQQEMALPEMPE